MFRYCLFQPRVSLVPVSGLPSLSAGQAVQKAEDVVKSTYPGSLAISEALSSLDVAFVAQRDSVAGMVPATLTPGLDMMSFEVLCWYPTFGLLILIWAFRIHTLAVPGDHGVAESD